MKIFSLIVSVAFLSSFCWAGNVKMKCQSPSVQEILYAGPTTPDESEIDQQVLWINGAPLKQYRYTFDKESGGAWSVTIATIQDRTTLKNYRIDFTKVGPSNSALEISLQQTGRNQIIETGHCVLL